MSSRVRHRSTPPRRQSTPMVFAKKTNCHHNSRLRWQLTITAPHPALFRPAPVAHCRPLSLIVTNAIDYIHFTLDKPRPSLVRSSLGDSAPTVAPRRRCETVTTATPRGKRQPPQHPRRETSRYQTVLTATPPRRAGNVSDRRTRMRDRWPRRYQTVTRRAGRVTDPKPRRYQTGPTVSPPSEPGASATGGRYQTGPTVSPPSEPRASATGGRYQTVGTANRPSEPGASATGDRENGSRRPTDTKRRKRWPHAKPSAADRPATVTKRLNRHSANDRHSDRA
jgi:hypothetical protein